MTAITLVIIGILTMIGVVFLLGRKDRRDQSQGASFFGTDNGSRSSEHSGGDTGGRDVSHDGGGFDWGDSGSGGDGGGGGGGE